MKRTHDARKVVELGVASRETKGQGLLSKDAAGRNPFAGLAND